VSESYGIIARAGSDGLTFLTESIGEDEALVLFDSPERAGSFRRQVELSPKFLVYESSREQILELLDNLAGEVEYVVLNPPADLQESAEPVPVGEFVRSLRG
jgi:hypothetical protein